MLRQLSIFVGDFLLDAAIAVTGDQVQGDVTDHVANLVAKSLIAADIRGDRPYYRLLDTTRVYALEKLKAAAASSPISPGVMPPIMSAS